MTESGLISRIIRKIFVKLNYHIIVGYIKSYLYFKYFEEEDLLEYCFKI